MRRPPKPMRVRAPLCAWAPGLMSAVLVATGIVVSAHAADWHVAPGGTPEGIGTEDDPLDLATAWSAESPVQPGDTVLLHGGVYEGSFVAALSGTEIDPITVQSAPGEWAVIDGADSVRLSHTLVSLHYVPGLLEQAA